MAARLARFSWLPGGLAAAFVIVVGRLISSTTYAPVELMLYDRVMRATPATPASDVTIVAIDDASIAKLGAWPWPRDVHAGLIAHLTSAGARVIAFSVPIDTSPRTSEAERLRAALALLESSDLGGSEQAQQLRRLLGESSSGRDPDAHLAQAIQAHGNVVLPADVRLVDASGGKSELPSRLFSARRRGRAACRTHGRSRRRADPAARTRNRCGRSHANDPGPRRHGSLRRGGAAGRRRRAAAFAGDGHRRACVRRCARRRRLRLGKRARARRASPSAHGRADPAPALFRARAGAVCAVAVLARDGRRRPVRTAARQDRHRRLPRFGARCARNRDDARQRCIPDGVDDC